MDKPSISYTPRADASPAVELSALSAVFRYVLDCHTKKEATRPGSPDDAMKVSRNDRAKDIIPKRS